MNNENKLEQLPEQPKEKSLDELIAEAEAEEQTDEFNERKNWFSQR